MIIYDFTYRIYSLILFFIFLGTKTWNLSQSTMENKITIFDLCTKSNMRADKKNNINYVITYKTKLKK